MKEKYFIDLDGTLWETNARAWIIDKQYPEYPIIKLTGHEFNLIAKGNYIDDDNRIYYNGFEGWLSNEQLTKIKQKKPIDIDRIGLSTREYNSIEFIVNQKNGIKFHTNRFTDLTNKITILTARGNKNAHKPLLEQLNNELSKIGMEIEDSVFIYDVNEFKYNNIGDTSVKKLIKLIQSLIGFEIHNNKFVPIQTEEFDIVHFYDDEDKNIEICKDINKFIIEYYNNSSNIVKNRIKEKKFHNKKLITNLVTTNKMNPFIIDEVAINKLN